MENPIFIALSRQKALEAQMDMVANNLANMNTTGFKQQRILFQEYVEQPTRREPVSFVQDYGYMRDVRPGAITVTDNPLDVALRGEGYFSVETMSGPRYTRAGNFQLNPSRELVDQNGLPVLDSNNNRITIPAEARQIRIQGDGTVMADNTQVGKIAVVSFADEQQMKPMGSGLYSTSQTPTPVSAPDVTQGALENSNVQPITETTSMISVMRQYEMAQKLLDQEDTRIRDAVQHLGKIQ